MTDVAIIRVFAAKSSSICWKKYVAGIVYTTVRVCFSQKQGGLH